jgi:predicted nuclease of predicted toxin-antitoxin system
VTLLRLLANENFPQPSIEILRAAGHDVLAIREYAPRSSDQAVLSLAVEQYRWILTFDRDYGDLIFARGVQHPPSVILLRLDSYRPEDPGRLLLRVFDEGLAFDGFFVVIEVERLRRRPMPMTS